MQNDFEKSVRQKMDELKFVPTAPVWTGIESQIRRKKDRRWLIIWLPLLCLLLAGGVIWINMGNRPLTEVAAPANPTSSQIPAIQKQFSDQTVNTITNEERRSGSETERSSNEKQSIGDKSVEYKQSVSIKEKNFASLKKPDALVVKSSAKQKSVQHKTENKNTTNNHLLPSKNETSEAVIEKQATESEPKEFFAEKKIMSAKSEEDTLAKKEENIVVDSSNTKEPVQKQLKTGQKWKFAIVAQAGKSGLGDGLNFGAQKEVMDPLTSNPNTPFTNADHGNAPRKEGLSFSAGIALSREIRSRLNFTAGLQYNYYSYTLNIGEDSLGISTGIRYYFSASQNNSRDYKNSFHFIALPVALEWQMFKRVPLNIKGGLSLQQMIGSNAIVYSNQNSAYVSDKKALNHTQLFTQLGLGYSFKLNKAMTLEVGPEMQYGISKMEKNKSNRHLYQAGLNARIIF